ncbi:MAG: hypothetical protein ACFFC1_03900, partial [Promethearchaeota archaeon]
MNNSNIDKNTEFNDDININNKNWNTSALSERIHIDNNWTDAKVAGICTGSGTYSDPFIIKDLEIDGGGAGNGIWIQNSDAYFKIENCTVYNSGSEKGDAGIRLESVSNGTL